MNESALPLAEQATRAAYGWGRSQSWPDALALLKRAAETDANAAAQWALISGIDPEELLTPPAPQRLSTIARIAKVSGFAPPGFAERLIDRAKNRLTAAAANDAGGVAVRTARTCAFGPEHRDVVLAVLQERAARLFGLPVECHEPPNVISYEPGQEYRDHADFLEPSIPQFAAELRLLGQRRATIVTYLNADFEGAETEFPDAGVKFKGEPGDAIVFANVLPDGSPDYNTRHRALPPTRGRKWVLSQWLRTRPYPFPE